MSSLSAAHQSTNHDDDDTSSTKKPHRKRSGRGTNLTLDVQNLKQQIQIVETYRELLASKTLIQRHDPEGSLVRAAHEHYRIFRTGFNLRQTDRKRHAMSVQGQKDFLHSIFDEEVECGAGANGEIQRGIDVMVHQIMLYTIFIKSIAMTMTSFEVVVTDDTVVVATKGIMHFQILRNTIAGMFPHVLGEEWLMSKLVGQEVAPETSMDFYFNKHNKVCKFAVKLDFVKTFAGVLSSPEEVDILLGRALITEDCIIIPNNEEEGKFPPLDVGSDSSQDSSDAGSSSGSGVDSDAEDLPSTSSPASTKWSSPAGAAVSRGPMTPVDHFNGVVLAYFQHFAQGCHAATEAAASEFLARHVSPNVEYGDAVGRQVLHDRWRSLSWCFDVLSFSQMSPGAHVPSQSPADEPQKNRYRIETKAEYVLQITLRTTALVFPHVVSELEPTDLLVGSRIVVSSELIFWFERGTGLLAKVSERMAFEEALTQVVEDSEDLAYVLRGAQPILASLEGRVTSDAYSKKTEG